MDTGLLILRLLVGGLILGHSLQKLAGAFGGLGPDGTAPIFEKWGFVPGRPLVLLAASIELVAAVLLLLGLATPVGAALATSVMAVAASVNVAQGLWAQKGGYEIALTYGVIALALGFTGPGRFSLDRLAGLDDYDHTWAGLAALVVAAIGAAVFIGYSRSRRAAAPA